MATHAAPVQDSATHAGRARQCHCTVAQCSSGQCSRHAAHRIGKRIASPSAGPAWPVSRSYYARMQVSGDLVAFALLVLVLVVGLVLLVLIARWLWHAADVPRRL